MDRDFHPGQVADRWVRAKRALKAGDQKYADRLAGMIRAHSGDRIAQIRDPLEAAVFSLLVELVKEEEHSRDICQECQYRRDDQKND
jgi:kynureninase